jgi:pre-peptidase
MKRVCACLGIVVLLWACGDSRVLPTAPTSTPTVSSSTPADAPFPPPAPPGTTRTLVGTVRNEVNLPMAGVKVVVLAVGWFGAYTVGASAFTDGDGIYSMPAVRAYAGPDSIGWLLVGASAPGYFSDFKWWLDFPKDADLDLRLDPLRHIRLGEVTRGQIGDTECAGLGYGGWYGQRSPCQRFALTAPASGTLAVTVSAAMTDFDIDIVTSDGTFVAYDGYPYASGSPRVTIPVSAGSTYQIRLAGARREFELMTALQ